MNNKISNSEKMRIHIKNKHKNDKEFYKSKLNRHNDRTAILESLGINDKKGKNLYSQIYKKVLKSKKIYNNDYTETRFRISKFSDINATIKPEPQYPILEPIKTPVEKIKEEIIQEQSQFGQEHQQELESDLEQLTKIAHTIPEENVAYFWDGIWVIFRLKWAQIEGLSQEERQNLGKIWQPFFEKYTSEKFMLLVVPTIVTLGMFVKRILKARQIKKQREQEETEKTNEKKEVSK